MSKSNRFHPRQTATILAMAPRPSSYTGGKVVELPDTGSPPTPPKPDDAEILKAIGELSKKLTALAKNQSALSDRLQHLETLINNNSSNVVNGFVYMRWLMWAVGYWTCNEDDDTWGRNVPKEPHWR